MYYNPEKYIKLQGVMGCLGASWGMGWILVNTYFGIC